MTGSPRDPGGRLVIQTSIHSTRYWLLVPVEIGATITVDFVLDTGSPLTSMSRRLYERLLAAGYLARVRANRYELRSVQIGGHDIGPLYIRGSGFLPARTMGGSRAPAWHPVERVAADRAGLREEIV